MNLASVLLEAATRTPDAPAVRDADAAGGAVSHGDLAARAGRLARWVAGRVGPGDRVAIVAGNEVGFVEAYLAVLAAGAVAVPVDPGSPAPELRAQVERVGTALVLAAPDHAGAARDALHGRAGGDAAPDVTAPEVVALDAALAETVAPLDPMEPVARDTGDLAVLLATSGTAGAPKAAMLTHGNLVANLEQVQAHPGLALTADDVSLGVLPCFHVFGLNVVLGLSLAVGGSVVLVERFDPAGSLAAVARHRVTVVAGVPMLYAAWLALDHEQAPRDALATVRLAVSGAATLDPDLARQVRARFGVAVAEGYGLTEASPVVTSAAGFADERPGSIGPPVPGVEVRLVGADGADVLVGDPGEILVRGPNVFTGYWEAPDASARAVDADGWLHTGDVAVADDDGWLRLVDRAKDLIIVSGFNVYPAEVEEALAGLDGVAEAAVIGEPDARTGETVVAYVVAAPGSTVDPDTVVDHLAGRVARYKVPTRVEVVAALPRTLGGKLSRQALRDSTS